MSTAPHDTTSPSSGVALGVITVVMTLLSWSSVPLLIKHFSHAIDLWTSNGWRYGISALVWLPLVLWRLLERSVPPELWRAALVPALFNTLGQVTFGWAHYLIDPGLLTFGLRTQIVFVTAGAALLFVAERRVIRTRGYIGGLLMVVLGSVGLILLAPKFGEKASTLGVLMAITSGLTYGCYALSVRWFLGRFHPILAFAVICQYTAGVLVAMTLTLGDWHDAQSLGGVGFRGAKPLDFSGGQMLLFIASALIGIALGHVFYYISIRRLGVAVSSGIIQLQPILVSVASFFLFDERLTGGQWACGALALAGAACILVVQHRMSRAAAPTRPLIDLPAPAPPREKNAP